MITADHVAEALPVKARRSCKMATGEVQSTEFELTKGVSFKKGSSFPKSGIILKEDVGPKG